MTLERDLQRALRREPPAQGFEARLLTRIAVADSRATLPRPTPFASARFWGIAATLALTIGGATYWQHAAATARGDRAASELIRALEITSDTLALVERRVNAVEDRGADQGGLR